MAKRYRKPILEGDNAESQNAVHTFSPTEILDTSDPGDEIQRRFRYQHAYGVILLAASLRNKLPYKAIWCEQHEDLLGERQDGLYDAYQIKTQQPQYGLWNLTKSPLKDSIKRFVDLNQHFPEKFHEFCFISNVDYENSSVQSKLGRSPGKFLTAARKIASPEELVPPFTEIFAELCSYCGCNPSSLIKVIKKLKLKVGPGLNDFEALIAQQHLSELSVCKLWPAVSLKLLCEDLIAKVCKASSNDNDDPARHWFSLHEEDYHNPKLSAKRIAVEDIDRFINEHHSRFLNISKTTNGLSEHLKETLRLYLGKSFTEDMPAKLVQAGETDLNSATPLGQVFVDLNVKIRGLPRTYRTLNSSQLTLFESIEQASDTLEPVFAAQSGVLSGMDFLLKEHCLKVVAIGGPGQGKSTLGQYIAQVHRAILLHRERELYQDIPGKITKQREFKPKTVRTPFRIILKYFAQWLADGPAIDSIEAYIAEQICKGASRAQAVTAGDVQEILKDRPTFVIFDGLDEVTEPELRAHMILRIEEFLERAELLNADIQVLATSRPRGYSDQFNPQQYCHLELQTISVEKVREYAYRWTNVKAENDEERRRILDTLEECLSEDHTRLLLKTPLQVTIVLLIIKDGGRPPTQREALFQKYWETILRREKSKNKDIIRSEDNTLFNLHAYLGYVLHRRSADENVHALLPEKKFKENLNTSLFMDVNRLTIKNQIYTYSVALG